MLELENNVGYDFSVVSQTIFRYLLKKLGLEVSKSVSFIWKSVIFVTSRNTNIDFILRHHF